MSIIDCYNCCNVLDAKNEGIEGCYVVINEATEIRALKRGTGV